MKLLEQTLDGLANGPKNQVALMTHVVLGYPTLQASMDTVCAMAESGAAIIELQIPFSDPTADGPTIMRACEQALRNGTTPRDCMNAMEKLSGKVSVPLLFMSYFNILYAYCRKQNECGVEHFLSAASSAGAQGVIVPDVPPEETQDGYWDFAVEYDLAAIPLVSPVTDDKRLQKIAAAAKGGFVYCISTTGTTGARKALAPDLKAYLNRVRRCFRRPLATGFGISQPDHIRSLRGSTEIAIVGSAMLNVIDSTAPKGRLAAVRRLTAELVRAGACP